MPNTPESLETMLQNLSGSLKAAGLKPESIKSQIAARKRYGLPYTDMFDTEIAEVIIREVGGAKFFIEDRNG